MRDVLYESTIIRYQDVAIVLRLMLRIGEVDHKDNHISSNEQDCHERERTQSFHNLFLQREKRIIRKIQEQTKKRFFIENFLCVCV